MYYTFGVSLTKAELWLVVILSKNFTELYDLLETLLTEEKRDIFIRKVIDMSNDTFILSEWEKEKMDRLKELARLEDAKIDGFDLGHKHGALEKQKEMIINMYNNNLSLDIISNCTNLEIKEIEKILNENDININ